MTRGYRFSGVSVATKDKRVDVYISNAQPFAQPILSELRKRLHAAVPGLEETIKWNSPFFLLDGRIFASMAGFKAHAKLNLWNADFKSAMPESTDFSDVKDLPAAAAFSKKLKASAAAFVPAQEKKASAKK
jgi:hypothetical protein